MTVFSLETVRPHHKRIHEIIIESSLFDEFCPYHDIRRDFHTYSCSQDGPGKLLPLEETFSFSPIVSELLQIGTIVVRRSFHIRYASLQEAISPSESCGLPADAVKSSDVVAVTSCMGTASSEPPL